MKEEAFLVALKEELARRIAEVSSYDDDTFGTLGSLELTVALVGFALIPIIIVWIFA